MAEKQRVTETPNCWLCANGKIQSAAATVTEFIDTAQVVCKLGLVPDCLECWKNYYQKVETSIDL